ncbi:MAG TPA: PTS fructose IIA subunit family protein [Rhodanobacteraceae bacterium]|jgi:PTS system ascorbate-specific IIA component|nr:PTS fructose IIA subunit family protein [Rhodanobacteraceae bacterium]
MTTATARRPDEMAPAGILLLTHEEIGRALIAAAQHVMPRLPCQLDALEVGANDDPDTLLDAAARAARALDHGGGVLVLADLYGGTPCNIANKLTARGLRARCVSGLNLPMLLRVLNYVDKPLDELAEVAASGGRSGICIDKG